MTIFSEVIRQRDEADEAVRRLMALVKDLAECDPTVDDPYNSRYCVLCNGQEHRERHYPDCPWLLAKGLVEGS